MPLPVDEIQTQLGPVVWVEKTGDMLVRICVAYEHRAGLLFTPNEAQKLIEMLQLKLAEIAAFK